MVTPNQQRVPTKRGQREEGTRIDIPAEPITEEQKQNGSGSRRGGGG